MSTTLIALHGFTQNGAHMHQMLAPLAARLPTSVTLECPTGPNDCAESSVARMYQLFGGERHEPPFRCWFDASDDGREYRGFEHTKHELAALIEQHRQQQRRVGLLGFSQGAIGGAALAALSAHGRFPKLDFTIFIAGRTPRSDEVRPLLDKPIAIPSLHIWGERDVVAKSHIQPLVELFDSATRHLVTWPGPHVVPTRGVAADAIVSFIAANG